MLDALMITAGLPIIIRPGGDGIEDYQSITFYAADSGQRPLVEFIIAYTRYLDSFPGSVYTGRLYSDMLLTKSVKMSLEDCSEVIQLYNAKPYNACTIQPHGYVSGLLLNSHVESGGSFQDNTNPCNLEMSMVIGAVNYIDYSSYHLHHTQDVRIFVDDGRTKQPPRELRFIGSACYRRTIPLNALYRHGEWNDTVDFAKHKSGNPYEKSIYPCDTRVAPDILW